MKYFVFGIIMLFPIFFICMVNDVSLGKQENEHEQLAIKAFRERYNWMKDYSLTTYNEDVTFYNNIHIVLLLVDDAEPASSYIIAIDKNKKTYIFDSHDNTDEFNNLVVNNKIEINNENIQSFFNFFLYLVDNRSVVISNYADIKNVANYAFDYIKNNCQIKLTPPSFEFRNDKIIADFFSCDKFGSIKKWNNVYIINGVVLTNYFEGICRAPLRLR